MADKAKTNKAKTRQHNKNQPYFNKRNAGLLASGIDPHHRNPRKRKASGGTLTQTQPSEAKNRDHQESWHYRYVCSCGYELRTTVSLRKVNRETLCPECKVVGNFMEE
ncbi:MAG: hypothetical protein A3A61_00500 [Candidatus Woykebacteria bacterium RIFCSPLOWO2_01_FULL_43_14]|uniref:Uncharacterized protein n=2 Tax=Candidatus Woykeibacteriota TaxID=1817899 RepID=A0A1G1WTN1_9BACT|nr:MAG: hypothetical protein A3J50_03610 [Candidatus Woykebacteria bacterium RIFCSPHIGHO2_02_FULL_43_16b]OGY31106.1 MAG: hypothetical protein A3A61_00500 [Candidatus Woykebacteria bacterium RIFCSPLOWO2_01_FULL_43_14]